MKILLICFFTAIPLMTIAQKKDTTKKDIPTIRVGWAKTTPNLLCSTYSETKFALQGTDFKHTIFKTNNIVDEDSAWIFRQSPEPGKPINRGESVELYLIQEYPKACNGEG